MLMPRPDCLLDICSDPRRSRRFLSALASLLSTDPRAGERERERERGRKKHVSAAAATAIRSGSGFLLFSYSADMDFLGSNEFTLGF